MSDLLKWGDRLPENYYYTVTHLWIQHPETGRVEVTPRYNEEYPGHDDDSLPHIHRDHWDEFVWDLPQRGYYSPAQGIVHSHGEVSVDLERKLARKFSDAIYLHSHSRT